MVSWFRCVSRLVWAPVRERIRVCTSGELGIAIFWTCDDASGLFMQSDMHVSEY